MGQQPNVVDPLTTALNHATTLYQAFTGLRQNLANYYMIANAFLAAAYVGAYGTKHALLTAGVALTGIVAAIGAVALDRRSNVLLRATEIPIKELQGPSRKISALPPYGSWRRSMLGWGHEAELS
jgi:hypothetical protein